VKTEMKSKNLLIVLVLVAVLIATPLIASVQAAPKSEVTRRSAVFLGKEYLYTQTKVTLGGADNWIKIPDIWNGKLVVLCRGYLHVLDSSIPLDSSTVSFIGLGYATAASNYGEGGYCVKEGIIHTHQLTEYVIDNYGVTGNVYLFGASMGGNIVLQLGAKYPDLYDGVFDLFGSKDLKKQYTDKMNYVGMNDADLIAALTLAGSAIPPFPFSMIPGLTLTQKLDAFQSFSLDSGTDIWLACGGNTPEEKPKAYERISPTFSSIDIAVPTITVHGSADGLVPYSQSLEFKNAVTAAGHSDLYRLYKVDGKGHGDISNAVIGLRFGQLVAWVESGTLPPDSSL
jgi:pimeloyl-ACP methyl ester carboxylesterase